MTARQKLIELAGGNDPTKWGGDPTTTKAKAQISTMVMGAVRAETLKCAHEIAPQHLVEKLVDDALERVAQRLLDLHARELERG